MGCSVGSHRDSDISTWKRRPAGTFRIAGVRPWSLVLAGVVSGWFASTPALALDGVLGARGTHQEGRAGTFAYSADQLFVNSSVEERLRLAPGLGARVSYLVTWEDRENRIGGTTSDYETWLGRPQASLTYSGSWLRCSWAWGMRCAPNSAATGRGSIGTTASTTASSWEWTSNAARWSPAGAAARSNAASPTACTATPT